MAVVAINAGPAGRARTIAASRWRSPMAIPNPVPNVRARRQKGSVTGLLESVTEAAGVSTDRVLMSGHTNAGLRTRAHWFPCRPENETSPALRQCGADRITFHPPV